MDTANFNLTDEKKHDISQGARHILRESWVSASDPHYDAKGTSLFSKLRDHNVMTDVLLLAVLPGARRSESHQEL